MMEIRFQNRFETTSEASTNKKSALIKLFESRDVEDKFRYAKKYEMGQFRYSQNLAREETTHTKKIGLNASTGTRDTARDLLLGNPVSDRFGNRFFKIASTL